MKGKGFGSRNTLLQLSRSACDVLLISAACIVFGSAVLPTRRRMICCVMFSAFPTKFHSSFLRRTSKLVFRNVLFHSLPDQADEASEREKQKEGMLMRYPERNRSKNQ